MRITIIALWLIGALAAAVAFHPTRCNGSDGDWPYSAFTGAAWPFFVIGRIAVWALNPDLAMKPIGCPVVILQERQ